MTDSVEGIRSSTIAHDVKKMKLFFCFFRGEGHIFVLVISERGVIMYAFLVVEVSSNYFSFTNSCLNFFFVCGTTIYLEIK